MRIDPTILNKCKKGDRKAQFDLYNRCFPILMGVCMRYKKDESEAAQILNTGFLKILNGLKKYKDNVPFEAWIRRIMINTVIDEFRKNKKSRDLVEHTNFETPEFYSDQVDYNIADQAFDAEDVQRFIDKLPKMSKRVFNLFAIDGYSHREVSEELGISVGTSKWHLSFARSKVQELMKEAIDSAKIFKYGK